MKKFQALLFLGFIFATRISLSADPLLPLKNSSDLAADAAIAKQSGVPVMLVFGASDCNYCKRLEDEVIKPGVVSGDLNNRVILHEVNIDDGGKITDFDDSQIRNRIFVSRYEVFATPTVVLVDHNGEPLSAPIIGYNGVEKYQQLMDEAIERAQLSLSTKNAPRHAKSTY